MTVEDEHGERLARYVPDMLLGWPEEVKHRTMTGTLVSADISGFTALSERLAARGRHGVEELNALLNACFDGMVDDCTAEGGDVLKFGGDALLVWFEGERHTERACRAAAAMRSTIRTQRRTSDGVRVRLAVSTGVHSGAHTFAVVHGAHTELIVAGPGATATVRAESAAAAGEILLTAPTAAALPESWRGDTLAEGTLLRRTFGRRGNAPSPVRLQRNDAARFVPAEQRAQIVAGAANEHRLVSIAFLAFDDTDRLDIATLADRVQRLAETIAEVCARNGVFWLTSDVAADGGKIVLTAGAPISLGGDEDRLLRAVREVVDADPGLGLRAGVNRGYVFAGDLGSHTRCTYTTLGDATNLAARLCGTAGAGEIVATRPMIDWASSHFEYTARPPFHVKGKAAPIYAGVLGSLLGRRSDLDQADTELSGRRRELDGLLERADDAEVGRGSMVMITGDPGIGKSRLAVEAIRLRPQLAFSFARCQPYDRLDSFSVAQPLVRAMLGIDVDDDTDVAGGALLGRLREHAPELLPMAPLLATVIGARVPMTTEVEGIVTEFRRVRTSQVVIDLVQRVLRRPTVLLVDDVNLADDASRELFVALAESAANLPLLIIATSTPDDTLIPTPIRLQPLGDDDVRRLLDELLGDRVVGSDTVRAIVQRSGGNPLFVGELVRTLAEDPDAPMPQSLEALVTQRIDALEPADRYLLRQASILGTEVDIEMLGHITSDHLIRRQDRWEKLHRFLEWAAPGVVRFRFDTYWRVVYGGLSFAARRVGHQRVIELLEAGGAGADVTLLAAHAERAGDLPRTWRYAVAAAHAAASESMFGEAARLYDIAMGARRACADADEVARIAESAADAGESAGHLQQALTHIGLALRHSDEPLDRLRRLRKSGELAERSGDYARAVRRYRQAQREWGRMGWTQGIGERALLAVASAGLAYRQARYSTAWYDATAALTQATLAEEWHAAARAGHIVDNVIINMRWRGVHLERPDVVALYRRAGDLVGEARYVNNVAVDRYFAGDWHGAAELYRTAAELFVRVGDVINEATALNNIAEILSDQGRLDDAEQLFRTAARSWRSVGFATGVALVEANLGRLATRRGEFDASRRLLTTAIERFQALDAEAFVVECRLRLADNALLSDGGDLDVELTSDDDWDANLVVYALRLMAVRAARRGDTGSAAQFIADSIERARSADIPFELAQSLLVQAALTGDGATEAEAILAGLGVHRPAMSPECGPADVAP